MVRQLNLRYDNKVFNTLENIKNDADMTWEEVVLEAMKTFETIRKGVN